MRVEAARARDAPALARLAAAALPEAWSEHGFAEEIEAPVARVWVARGPTGGPIGYLVAHAVGDEIQVFSLAVDAGFRRRGIGRRLVEHALEQEPGAAIVHLEVRSDDAGAQAFYERLRFRAVGRRPGFYPGGIDAISLARVLVPPGAATDDSQGRGAGRRRPRSCPAGCSTAPAGVDSSLSLSILSDSDRLRRLWSGA